MRSRFSKIKDKRPSVNFQLIVMHSEFMSALFLTGSENVTKGRQAQDTKVVTNSQTLILVTDHVMKYEL